MKWQSQHFSILSYGDKLISWPFVLKKPGKSNFWTRSWSGWVLTHLRTFRMAIQHFLICHMVLNSFLAFLCSQNQENQIFGARSSSGWVLTHVRTFVHMWELSTFHSLQLSISSYHVKMNPRRPKLHFRLFAVFIVVFYHFHSRF